MNGQLIIFEGADGTGKSHLCEALVQRLRLNRRTVSPLSFPGRTPGTLGKVIYDMHLDCSIFGITAIDPTAKQCLHIAAHLDAITDRILPEIENGATVILDRYWWSTYVYGVVDGANRPVINKLIDAEIIAWRDVVPTALFLIDRTSPLRDEPLEKWHAWRTEYLAVAEREKSRYPVHIISNDSSSANDALETICDLL